MVFGAFAFDEGVLLVATEVGSLHFAYIRRDVNLASAPQVCVMV